MKKFILAFDSFKGSASSRSLAASAQKAILADDPCHKVVTFPIADGGEGTMDAISSQLKTKPVTCTCHGPLMQPMTASYQITDDGTTAILEMSAVSGITLISPDQRNPLRTTTYGTGELVADALSRGCRQIILGLGGSATNDAGTGMLSALGIRFLDKDGKELDPIGLNLQRISHIDENHQHPALNDAAFVLACDVTNPFYGPKGAAYIFAPQKGATPEEVRILDAGLKHYAEILKTLKGTDISQTAGSGAAGGMGGGLLPFLHANINSGIDTVLNFLHFEDEIKDADLIITGEGQLDSQTGMGKAIGGIVKLAKRHDVPVVAIGGSVRDTEQLNAMGLSAVFSIQTGPISLQEAMNTDTTLKNTEHIVSQIIHLISSINP